jgi:hypothetical protein
MEWPGAAQVLASRRTGHILPGRPKYSLWGFDTMNALTRRVSTTFFLFLCSCSAFAAYDTKHVVIVVLDGARYTETFGDSSHANIPMIWTRLRAQGTIYTSVRNDGPTWTNSGHASILTGTRESLKNDGTELPLSPTLFEYYRKQTGAPASTCWVALGKTKLQMLSQSKHAQYGASYAASVKTSVSEYDDRIAIENARLVLSTNHPAITIVNLAATDEFAHTNNWWAYIDAIRKADTLVTLLWDAIRSDPVLRDSTTLILVNDHGRHTKDFTEHGDHCEGCTRIMLLVIGPDTPAGVLDSRALKQVDLAPTVGALLRFNTPYSTGAVIESAVDSKERKLTR